MKALFFISLTILLLSYITPAQLDQCDGPKTTTLPFAGDYGGAGSLGVTRQIIVNPDPDAPAPVSVFIPSNASLTNKVPVIFFSHAYGAFDFRLYEDLLRQLASRGYAVVYSPYSTSITVDHPKRYNQLWGGFTIAVQQFGGVLDTTRVGFAGHSFGAGATPEMARRGANAGWGANGLFLFVMAPWYNWGSNMEQVPATAKMIVQVYWDDAVNQHLIAQNDVWNRLPQIIERKWQVIRAAQTYCALNAGHSVPTTGSLGSSDGVFNGYDAWGVGRRIDALAAYTFTGSQAAKNVAFGVDAKMGRWRGQFAVRPIPPLETYDAPLVNMQTVPTFLWSERCNFAQGLPCP
ncbi:MAG: hypothetical protein JSS81_09860 [Acidobacteria bacterium]|nr:hypothetical protein [Acidobacteriota bacterium]